MSPLQAELRQLIVDGALALAICKGDGPTEEEARRKTHRRMVNMVERLDREGWEEPPLPLTLARAMAGEIPLEPILHDRD